MPALFAAETASRCIAENEIGGRIGRVLGIVKATLWSQGQRDGNFFPPDSA
jgi:hypothetical protein